MKPRFRILTLGLFLAVAACSKAPVDDKPASIARGDACSLDGMTLADFPGPKGQIVWANGQHDFFCDTREIVATLLKPEQQRAMKGAYVQDMAKTEWDKPQDAWIDAKAAFYVQGSKRHGSMGPTLASFAERGAADAFAQKYGGKVVAYAEIKPDAVSMDGGMDHDQKM